MTFQGDEERDFADLASLGPVLLARRFWLQLRPDKVRKSFVEGDTDVLCTGT